MIFRMIGRKSDPKTRVRGLEKLISEVFRNATGSSHSHSHASSSPNDDDVDRVRAARRTAGTDGDEDDDVDDIDKNDVVDVGGGTEEVGGNDDYPRSERIAALCHLCHLHETRLGYDDDPAVRASSYGALNASRRAVPGAFVKLFVGSPGNCFRERAVVGMAWGAHSGDASTDAMRNAGEFVSYLLMSGGGRTTRRVDDDDGGDGDGGGGGDVDDDGVVLIPSSAPSTVHLPSSFVKAICSYSIDVLACRRPSALGDYVDRRPSSTSSGMGSAAAAAVVTVASTKMHGGGKGKVAAVARIANDNASSRDGVGGGGGGGGG